MRLSKQLKHYRELNNETQESLALKLRVTRQSVSKWERGTCYPDLSSLSEMSKIYKISLEELVKGVRFFNLPFDIGIKFTKKELIKHFLVIAIPYFFFSLALSVAVARESDFRALITTILICTLVFIVFYGILISKTSQRYRHWQITKDGFKVYAPSLLTMFKRPFRILRQGDDVSLYKLIPFQDVKRVEIIYMKFILNPKYSLMPSPGPLFVNVRTEPFMILIVTNKDKHYYEDMIIDYIRCGANAYFFLPDIKDLLDKKGIPFVDQYDFVSHAAKGELIHDYLYGPPDPKVNRS